MHTETLEAVLVERRKIHSRFLEREVIVDFYLPKHALHHAAPVSLLLINDGQDLVKMHFQRMLDDLLSGHQIQPVLCVGIHAGEDRKNEYGTAKILDFKGRGAKAASYQQFILQELLPAIPILYAIESFKTFAFAGFSLGGLMAIDTVWACPELFSIAGVFSGSLWWRTKALEDGYKEETDRIMHGQIRAGAYYPGLKFYFTTGSLDETADRNNNGIIDSIDDTLGLMEELKNKGYRPGDEIEYINYEDGRHDVLTWGRAMPRFLLWGWGRKD